MGTGPQQANGPRAGVRMTRPRERSRARDCPERFSGSKGGGVHRETQSTHAQARSRLCARVRGSAALFCSAARRYLWVSMATGRGRLLRQGCFGLPELRAALHGGGATWGSVGLAAGRSGFR